MSQDVTICIPSIPVRLSQLRRAIGSVTRQTKPAQAVAVVFDWEHHGAWHTRSRTVDMVATEWIAFLDDDDEFYPQHLQRCFEVQEETGADIIVPWYDVIGSTDPVPHNRSLQIDPKALHSFCITCLVRREAIGDIRFENRDVTGIPEDWKFWNDLAAAGATFHQFPESTWAWHHWGLNTSGKGDRW